MAMKIIGLSAKMHCGKSTLAKKIIENLPGTVRLAFGDALKSEASVIYGFPIELAYCEAGKNTVVALSAAGAMLMHRPTATVREILQYHGSQLRRVQDPQYWDNAVARQLQMLEGAGVRCAVIDDVRFPSEVKLLYGLGGKVFRINPYPGWQPGPNANHSSETALDGYGEVDFDGVFSPAKGLHHLEALAYSILAHMEDAHV